MLCFFFQAEDGIRDAQESRGLGDVYKRQTLPIRVMQRLKINQIILTNAAGAINPDFSAGEVMMLSLIHI